MATCNMDREPPWTSPARLSDKRLGHSMLSLHEANGALGGRLARRSEIQMVHLPPHPNPPPPPPPNPPPPPTVAPSFSSVVVFAAIMGAPLVSAAGLLGFAYMTAHAPPGTSSTMTFSNPTCKWMAELQAGNPFGCLKPRFDSSTVRPLHDARVTRCSGRLFDELFDSSRGDNFYIDADEIKPFSGGVDKAVEDLGCRGVQPPVHTCFAHATSADRMDKAEAGAFVRCRLRSLGDACLADVCGAE